MRSNWCAACKKSFEDNEYKLHIQTEHQFDLHTAITDNDSDDNEHLPFDNGYVLLSKKRIKKEPETETRILLSDIKIEPMSEEESCSSLPKKTTQKVKRVWFLTCPECGSKFKGPRGLRQHKMMMHKGKQKSSNTLLDYDQGESEEDVDNPPETEVDATDTNNYSPMTSTNIGAINIGQNSSGLPLYKLYVPNNIVSADNQANIQIPPIHGNGDVKVLEYLPKFDCDSEEYSMWLKKFVGKCKQKIPLPRHICDNLNHVQHEIASALHEQSGNLKKKANHFYFMKMHSILTEILIDQMRYNLSVAGN